MTKPGQKPAQAPAAAQVRPGARRAAKPTPRRKGPPVALLVGLGVVVVVAIMVAVKFLAPPAGPAADAPVPAAVLTAVESVSIAEAEQIGPGSSAGTFGRVSGPKLTGASGLPKIVYMGAEYCPYCAAQRWGVVVALSRFGRFQNLHLSSSATDDVYPGTPTFTFHGATYQSSYLDFTAVEMQSNVKVNGQYAVLDKPDPGEAALLQTYDAPPYLPADDAGSIPFIDVANQFVFSGSFFDPGVLAGKSWSTVASSLSDPTSPVARGIIGTANDLTGAICIVTGDKPADVCAAPAIQLIKHKLTTAQH